jgi:hypothetical protein
MKKMILGVAVAAAMLTTAMMGSTARADETGDDVKCLVIFMQMSNVQAPQAQTGGLIGSFYYMGKLDGRIQGLDLEKLILDEISKMSENSFQADATRCGNDMTKRGQAAADLGKALQQHAAQMQKPGADDKPDVNSGAKPDAKPDTKSVDKPKGKPQDKSQ